MPEWILSHSYLYLFIVCFLAATVVPLASEGLLALLAGGAENLFPLVVVATVGNVLGALSTYAAGRYGGGPLSRKYLGISDTQQKRAERFYRRYGIWSLFLAFLPIVGDPLCFIGGLLRTPMAWFIPLVALGKALRYLAVALTAARIL